GASPGGAEPAGEQGALKRVLRPPSVSRKRLARNRRPSAPGRTLSMIAAAPVVVPAKHQGGGGPPSPEDGGGERPSPICLRVRDLARSQRFYSEVLGFIADGDAACSDQRSVLVSPLLANGFRSIVLTRVEAAHEVSGLLLELETTGELLDRYILAR